MINLTWIQILPIGFGIWELHPFYSPNLITRMCRVLTKSALAPLLSTLVELSLTEILSFILQSDVQLGFVLACHSTFWQACNPNQSLLGFLVVWWFFYLDFVCIKLMYILRCLFIWFCYDFIKLMCILICMCSKSATK